MGVGPGGGQLSRNVPSSQTWWKSAGRLESHHGPIEAGRRSFFGSSTLRLLHIAGSTGAACRKATKEVAEEAEKGNFWLWLRRKHKSWGPSNTQGISIALLPGDVLGSEEQHIHTATGGPKLMSRSGPPRRSERHGNTKTPVEVRQTAMPSR